MSSSLSWFSNDQFPLYLAPMAGVTDVVFRSICKELGADVMVTEFVSAEGIIRQDERTRKYTEFTEEQRVAVEKAAGMVADLGQKAQAGGGQRAVCVTRPSDGPEYPKTEGEASTRLFTARSSEPA